MPLPEVPLLNLDDSLALVNDDLELIAEHLYDINRYLPNAAGEAIDPTEGRGGDGSLTIESAPSNIVYNPGSSLSIDGVLFGHIDISFTLPDRATEVLVLYKEQNAKDFCHLIVESSPFTLPNLMVGVTYSLKMAGIAANNAIGPFSNETLVEIPTTPLDSMPPTNLQAVATYQSVVLTWVAPISGGLQRYQVDSADDASFLSNVKKYFVDTTYLVDDLGGLDLTRYYRVRTTARGGTASEYTPTVSATTINVPDNSISYDKIVDFTADSKLLGRGDSGPGDPEEISLGGEFRMTGTTLENNPNTGWSVTNHVTDKSYNASSTTVNELANVLGTLIEEVLKIKNILGA